eukprot:CAMPEP_0117763094 /NCGR_PEP_ID=MMETSP0947-20121206/18396_1 /TAXON_ID=44440 /ORGANISM="Chattonella subsalsa, Strain CCMP2191" /LENGTH=216 /DNA_ID=CAMNT_0005584661 /DNA_START=192 /DNA_END=842 /DNA_ORIENTATION=+
MHIDSLKENQIQLGETRTKFLSKSFLATFAFISSFNLLPNEASAGLNPFERPKPTRDLEDCLLSIARVQYTTEQIEEAINQGEYDNLGKQLNMVLVNYRVADSVKQASLHVSPGDNETKVKNFGRDGIEYINQILEYFPDDFDPVTMKKLPPSQQFTPAKLQFTVKALQASRQKFNGIFEVMPQEVVANVKRIIDEETNYVEENEETEELSSDAEL